MRTLIATIGVVMMLVALATSVGAPVADAQPPIDWVRTVDGWENASSLGVGRWTPLPLHPLVVAATQLLASLMVLVAGSAD